RVRLTVRVLRVSDGKGLLAESFDEALNDVFTMQDAVCRRIVDALSLELSRSELDRLTHAETSSLEAYRHYLLGRLNANRRTPDGDFRAIERFQQAVERDPGYAVAWAALADAYDSL